MSSEIRNNVLTVEASTTITRYQLIYENSSNEWAIASATSVAPTHVACDNAEDGDQLAGIALNAGGTLKMVASAAITAGAAVYQAASGKISSTVSGAFLGFAREAATADGDVIEVRIPTPGESLGFRPVLNVTAHTTLSEGMSGCVITNLGAGATVTVSLPTGCKAGTHFYVVPSAAQRIQVDPGASDGIYQNGVLNGDGKYMWADDEAESALFICTSTGDWVALHTTGTWTVEP